MWIHIGDAINGKIIWLLIRLSLSLCQRHLEHGGHPFQCLTMVPTKNMIRRWRNLDGYDWVLGATPICQSVSTIEDEDNYGRGNIIWLLIRLSLSMRRRRLEHGGHPSQCSTMAPTKRAVQRWRNPDCYGWVLGATPIYQSVSTVEDEGNCFVNTMGRA